MEGDPGMVVHVGDALLGLGLYAALCLLATGAGFGLMKLLTLRLEGRLGVVLAPVLGLAFWAVALGVLGAFSLPIRLVAPWLWGATLLLGAYGCYGRLRALLPALPLLGLCGCLPVLGMSKAFAFGLTEYTPALASDGWAYLAAAQYQWEFGRKPLPERTHFQDTGYLQHESRYISFSFLALFSSLYKKGETIYLGALHQALCLFCTACGLLFFWLVERRRTWVALAATAATVLCGWSLRVVWFNNYDNGLLLPLLPALAGLLGVMSPADRRARLVCGLLLAAAFYVYVEGVPAGLAGVALFSWPRLWRERREARAWLAAAGTALVVALVLLLPASKVLYVYMADQFDAVNLFVTSGDSGPIPGLYHGEDFLPAAWSLKGYWTAAAPAHRKEMRCAVALTCLLGLGLLRLLGRRQWGLPTALALFLAGAGYMVWSKHCDYGAYKMLNLGWWCVMAVVVAGAEAVVALVRFRPLQVAAVAGVFWLAYRYAYLTQVGPEPDTTPLYARRLSEFQHLETLRAVVGNEPVVDACEDWLASLNSRYFHRSLNPYPVVLRGIVRFCHEDWRNARPVSPRTRYLLADAAPTPLGPYLARTANRVARAGPYTLWRLDPDGRGANLVGVENPYGLDANRGFPLFWMGPEPTTLHVLAARPGTLVCNLWCVMGPCGPTVPTRTVKVVTDGSPPQPYTLGERRESLRIAVRPGINRVRLQVIDKPTRSRASDTDPRALLLLIALDSIELAPDGETP
jgi:hypothetical protein